MMVVYISLEAYLPVQSPKAAICLHSPNPQLDCICCLMACNLLKPSKDDFNQVEDALDHEAKACILI